MVAPGFLIARPRVLVKGTFRWSWDNTPPAWLLRVHAGRFARWQRALSFTWLQEGRAGLHFESRDLVELEHVPCPHSHSLAAHLKQPVALINSSLGLPTPGPVVAFLVFMPSSEHLTSMLPALPWTSRCPPVAAAPQQPASCHLAAPAVCSSRMRPLLQACSPTPTPPLTPSHSCGFSFH